MDKIICVGKNYLEHAKELGDAVPEKPVLFLKPPSVLKQAQQWDETLHAYFPQDENVQPECEIVLRLKQGGYRMSLAEANEAIDAVTLGLDMTLRGLQTQLKKQGHPWTTAKVFLDAAIIGPWIAANHFNDFMLHEFVLEIDGAIRQQAKGGTMMMKPAELVAYASQFFTLCAGDIIFTGTPAGVSRITANSIAKVRWQNYSYQVRWSDREESEE